MIFLATRNISDIDKRYVSENGQKYMDWEMFRGKVNRLFQLVEYRRRKKNLGSPP